MLTLEVVMKRKMMPRPTIKNRATGGICALDPSKSVTVSPTFHFLLRSVIADRDNLCSYCLVV